MFIKKLFIIYNNENVFFSKLKTYLKILYHSKSSNNYLIDAK